jgi:hypothetical protein
MNSAHRPSLAVAAPAASITATTSAVPSLMSTLLFGQEQSQTPDASVEIVQSLSRRSDLELISYTRTVLKGLEGNPDFPLIQAVLPLALAQVDSFTQDITQIGNAEAQLRSLCSQKAQNRSTLETTFRTLGLLVQAESRNNPVKISSVGIRLKAKGAPTSTLPCPAGLTVNPGSNTGTLEVKWQAVRRCKGYIIRLALATPGEKEWTLQRVTGRPRLSLSGLQAGATYLVQVASLGSTQGQSPWSPEVSRICA